MDRLQIVTDLAQSEPPLTDEQLRYTMYIDRMMESFKQCTHSHKFITQRTISNGNVVAYTQCPECGKSNSVKKPKKGFDKCPQFNANLSDLQHLCWVAQGTIKAHNRDAARYDKLKYIDKSCPDYKEYLRSPEWWDRRTLVVKRCGNVCEGCRKAKVNHVHHLTYANIFDELLFQLVGLCRECHEKAHGRKFDAS